MKNYKTKALNEKGENYTAILPAQILKQIPREDLVFLDHIITGLNVATKTANMLEAERIESPEPNDEMKQVLDKINACLNMLADGLSEILRKISDDNLLITTDTSENRHVE